MNRSPGYVCAECGMSFGYVQDWTDEDMLREARENGWDGNTDKVLVIVCDDCYKQLMEAKNHKPGAPR